MQSERQIKNEIEFTLNFKDVADVLSVISSSYYKTLSDFYFKETNSKSQPDTKETKQFIKSNLDNVFPSSNLLEDDLVKENKFTKVMVIISCDQGFCGNFNTDLKKEVESTMKNNNYDNIYIYGKQFKLPSENNESTVTITRDSNIFYKNIFKELKSKESFKESLNFIDIIFDRILKSISEQSTRDENENVIYDICFNTFVHDIKKSEVKTERLYKIILDDNYGSSEENYYKYLSKQYPKESTEENIREMIIADPNPKTVLTTYLEIYNRLKLFDIFINSLITENYKRMNAMNQAKDEIEIILKKDL